MSDQLESELRLTIEDCQRWARRNYILAHMVFVVSVLGSFAAAVLASSDLGEEWFGESGNKATIAILAALPGLMLLLNNTLRFEDRTKWFWKKVRLAERYYREVRDTGETVSALSKRFSEESEKLEAEWPAFGSMPGQPSKPGS